MLWDSITGTAARQEKIASAVFAAGDTYLDVRSVTHFCATPTALMIDTGIYLQKIAALDKFKKTTKQKTKVGTHRIDWFQETDHLAGLVKVFRYTRECFPLRHI